MADQRRDAFTRRDDGGAGIRASRFALVLAFAMQMAEAASSDRPSQGYVTTPDGVRLFYRLEGEGNSVVLLPGAVYLLDDFRRLARDRRLIAYDLRNRGRSEAVADRARLERGIHQDADDMESMRKHFGVDRIAVVAHSYVGLVAILYAMNHAEHVSRVVSIGPAPPISGKSYSQPSDAAGLFAQAFSTLAEIREDSTLDPVSRCRRSWQALAPIYVADRRYARQIERWGACDLPTERNAMQHFNANILPTMKSLSISPEQAAKASMPVLIVHGALDRSAPYEGAKDWVTLLPSARLVTIENAAHAPWIEAPNEVFGAIDTFLGDD